ncbi:MAG: hypothetical protein EOP54_00705 [Sphingobacteriales bacterium]|nr:MAG: hypothetical protein EOP54_00705 [Sphingobacteriales bacterium]
MTQDTEDFKQRWTALEAMLTERFGKLPNMEAILYLIGINEYQGRTPKHKFSKEEKQDLMHIAICKVLTPAGYYAFSGYDEEGWPHFQELKPVPETTLEGQEQMLQRHILEYFDM